jgi:hypothetical protein
MNNVLLGAIDMGASPLPTGPLPVENLPYTPGGEVSLPNIPPVPPGGVVSLPKPEDIAVPVPTETPTEQPTGSGRKNMLLYGIGAVVLAYLLFRKK